jgi:HPt (histidine-containing phosphotransfer) domain-containing protein
LTFSQRSWRRLPYGIAIPTKARPQAETLSPKSPSAPHVDLERFRSDLREAGVEEMVGTLLQTFMEDCPGRFAALEQAVQQRNAKAIESAAHAFKSGSGTIRASVLAERLASVEADAHAGHLESIAVSLEQIRSEHLAVMRELEVTLNNGN